MKLGNQFRYDTAFKLAQVNYRAEDLIEFLSPFHFFAAINRIVHRTIDNATH